MVISVEIREVLNNYWNGVQKAVEGLFAQDHVKKADCQRLSSPASGRRYRYRNTSPMQTRQKVSKDTRAELPDPQIVVTDVGWRVYDRDRGAIEAYGRYQWIV